MPPRHQVKSPALVQALCFANEEIESQKEQVTPPRSPRELEQRQVPRKIRLASAPSQEAHSRAQGHWCLTWSLVPADALAPLWQGAQRRGASRPWRPVPRALGFCGRPRHGSPPSLRRRDSGDGALTQQPLSPHSFHCAECSSGNDGGDGSSQDGHLELPTSSPP